MEVAGIHAAQWVLTKALDSVTSGALEAWAASTELAHNIKDLKMELLYAQGMLNAARNRDRDQEIRNPALTELLQNIRSLGYWAEDVLDEVDYFRIQDELDSSYDAADEHQGGCLCNCALNARHTATSITQKLIGFAKCSRSDGHNEPAGYPSEEEDASRGVTCGGLLRPCKMSSSVPPLNSQQVDQEVDHGCMGRLASGARNTIYFAGKHLPCHSASSIQSHKSSNIASSEGRRRFLCCTWPSKAAQREHVIWTPKLKFNRVEISQTMREIVEQLKPVCAKVSTILNLELLDTNRSVAQWIATSLDEKLSNKRWHISNSSHKNAMIRPITTSEYIETEFYGREDETTKIIHDITTEEYCNMDLTVLPIVGPGGIGKTTLTRYIYNHVEVQKYFDVKLWVCVSVNFNVYRLTQEVAEQLSNDKRDSPNKVIDERLKSKRFLLVLDDMWNCSDPDEWKRFLGHFKKVQIKKGSVILVTTRFPGVAQVVKTVGQHIDMEGLGHEAFKELFFSCVFGEKKPSNDHIGLLETGNRILEKLKSSPLAAKTVGRLLRNNLNLDHWIRVLENKEWESQHSDHDIMPALKLSFDYLPFHLQQCFTYCALFPEDYKFGKEELIQFWIGIDALHSHSENISLEDIGQTHLDELVNHGFLKMEKNEKGDTFYVIHDLLHELALKVSAHECLSIYSSSVNSIQIFPSIRHLSINIDDSSFKDRMTFDDCKEDFSALHKRLKVENLYSLMLFGNYQASFLKTFCALFSRAKALRVIFMSGEYYSMEDLFPNYLNLIHLRYLRLSSGWRLPRNSGWRLPRNISRYYHLRVIHLCGCDPRYYDFTRDMSNLKKLRHFIVDYGDGKEHTKISNVGRLISLQGLKRFVVKNERQGFDLREVGQLLQLHGSLFIQNLEKVDSREEAEEARLMHKKHLREVVLEWDTDKSKKDPACEDQVLEGLMPNSNLLELSIINHPGVKCPPWLSIILSVKNLESLHLHNVAWKTFPPIGRLWQVDDELLPDLPNQNFHNLTTIELVKIDHVKKWVVDRASELYSCLKVLIIKDCNELMEVSFSDSTCCQDPNTWFPNMEKLIIRNCKKLSTLPQVPWTRDPCVIHIYEVCLGFVSLFYYRTGFDGPSLTVEGTSARHDTNDLWMALDFDNLIEVQSFFLKITEVQSLEVRKGCPPLPLDRFKMLSSLKELHISGNAFLPVQLDLAIEKVGFHSVGASGKELTQFLSMLPQLSNLSIGSCEMITMLGVAEQEQKDLREEDGMVEEGLLLLPPQLQELSISNCRELCLRPDSVGLQGMCSLSSLQIQSCPGFFSPYLAATSSSSCSPFPASLQSLDLRLQSLTDEPADCSIEEGKMVSLSNRTSLTELNIDGCGELRSLWCGNLPWGSQLTALRVRRTPSFFFNPPHQDGPSSPFSNLKLLCTDDAPRVLVLPICGLLASSLDELVLCDKTIECLKEEQGEALQLLTSLQVLSFASMKKLQCLPSGLRGLPNLKRLIIRNCDAICSIPKDSLPKSLQELIIGWCPSIRTLPKAGLPTSLRFLDVQDCESEELKGHCRKLIGTIPIVKV